jgi:hypothetical protein
MDQQQAAHRLLGTWKLVSVIRKEVPTGARVDLLGPDPKGFLNYNADGRMMVMIAVRSDRKKPAGNVPTATEADALFRSMNSYAGTYTVTENEVTHHVDISFNESWTGTKQTHFYKLENSRLTLSTSASPDPYDGKMSVRSLIWEKLKEAPG